MPHNDASVHYAWWPCHQHMPTLTRYQDFLDRADELGFMPLSDLLPGLPSLSNETPRHQWHTGNEDTDPWRWKDRAAREKRLAYGCILGGHKGFVAARLYPLFYAACHPAESVPERRAMGQVNPITWKLWQLIEEQGSINTGTARQLLGAAKGAAGQVDTALKSLQRTYDITVAGVEQKVSQAGVSYGWPATVLRLVTDWLPPDWIAGASAWSVTEAREAILDEGVALSRAVRRESLAKKLGF